MSLNDIPIETIDGRPTTFGEYAGQAVLVVNVASRCGLTPQYEQLEQLHEKYAGQGFSVLGFPCNQFGGQEPGSSEEIAEFCSTTYGVTFPMFAKVDVNGPDRHPVYAELVETADAEGHSGDIRWNFEKFLVDRAGAVQRFAPQTQPIELVPAIETALDAQA